MRSFYTVNTTDTRNILQGNGSATSIPTTFVFLQADHLVVWLLNEADEIIDPNGVVTDTPLTITTHYTVSGGGDGTSPATGTVNLTFTPIVGQTVVVERIVPTTQLTRLPDGGPFRGSTQERQYDLLAMAVQQLTGALGRALLAPVNFQEGGGGAGLNGVVIPTPIDEHILVGSNQQRYELRALSDILGGSGFSLSAIFIYETDSTWQKPPNFQGFLIVECVGGGAGGGGAAATGSKEAASAAGGGAGAYAWARIADVDLDNSVTVTVGAGGAGGGAGNSPGSDGGNTSFGVTVVAEGGKGGDGSAASDSNVLNNGGLGGLAANSTGDLTADGGDGSEGTVWRDSRSGGGLDDGFPMVLGDGGASVYGGIARAVIDAVARTGKKYGGGGPGAVNGPNQPARAGGNGYKGVCVVYQFGGSV